jgi:hypothetical protein
MHVFGEALPGLVLVLVTAVSAVLSGLILSRAKRGRARTAIAYLVGFAAGLACTVATTVWLGVGSEHARLGSFGLAGACAGPFIGMAFAKLRRPTRRTRPRGEPFGA